MAPVIFGYLDVRGIGNSIRYMLEYAGIQYDFKDHTKSLETSDWENEKHLLAMKFTNLPYLIDGEVRLTQSGAILRYLGRKYDLAAKNEKDQQTEEVLEGVLQDMRGMWSQLIYKAMDFNHDKLVYRKERLTPLLKQLEAFLSGKHFILGEQLNYNDFVLFELLDINNVLFPDLLDEFPSLKDFHGRMKNLKGVKEFIHSDRNPKKINGHKLTTGLPKWVGPEPNP